MAGGGRAALWILGVALALGVALVVLDRADAPERAPEVGRGSSLPPLPAALRGSAPPGRLRADAAGRLVPTPDLVRLFDHFLAGGEPHEIVVARIGAALDERLPATAADEARGVLDGYLAYRRALAELDAREADRPLSLDERLREVSALRREHLGEETAAALFGEAEQTAAILLELRRVGLDPSLDEAERDRRAAELQARLPARARRERARAAGPRMLPEQEQALRESGASEEEIEAVRARLEEGLGAALRSAAEREGEAREAPAAGP